MKRCDSCGTENADEVAFCPTCGKPMADSAKTETVAFSVGGTQAARDVSPKVEDHLVKSIIATICCCQPFGIVAIVYAAKVGPLLRENNFEAALEASRKANLWSNLAIGLGVLFQALSAIFFSQFVLADFLAGL
jgi:uncharacterized membrane protein YvbJ